MIARDLVFGEAVWVNTAQAKLDRYTMPAVCARILESDSTQAAVVIGSSVEWVQRGALYETKEEAEA